MLRFEQQIRTRFQVISTSGDERLCRCPFHDDRGKPNLYVNARTGLYFCHSCGAKGHVGKSTGHRSLAGLKDRLASVGRVEEQPFSQPKPEGWLDRFDNEHEFWSEDRGFSDATIKQFRLGYDPTDDMLTIPVRRLDGAVLGVIKRRTPEQVSMGLRPKYFHPTGMKMGRGLFAADQIAGPKVAICEGPLDAIACWDADVPAVAVYGARLSEHQAKVLRRLGVTTVVAMTDNDRAGEAAIESIHESLRGCVVLVGMYAPGWPKDPGELTRSQRRAMYDNPLPFHKAMV